MNQDSILKAEQLFMCLEKIDDELIHEAENTMVVFQKSGKKRLAKYGAVAAGASGVVAATYFLLRIRAGKKSSAII